MKKYNIVITKVDDDKVEVIVNEDLDSIMLLGETLDDKAAEILVNLSTMDMASLIAGSKEVYKAAKIGCVLRDLHEKKAPKLEDDLLDQIVGGLK